MERFILALLVCTNLVTAPFNVTRLEEGDRFVWPDSGISCYKFTDGTGEPYDHDGNICKCPNDINHLGTFSTESNECESYAGMDEGKELYMDV